MIGTTYTREQIADAERFAELLSRVPEEKRDSVIQTTEAVIFGIELAGKMGCSAQPSS